MKFLFVVSAIAFLCVSTFAQSHNSTQGHQESVTSFSSLSKGANANGSFFSAGDDGFLIKWTADGLGEHYQLTNLSIKLVAESPNGTDVAVYETDGAGIHTISVWNWTTLQKKFAKRFTDTITSLSYTAQGSYIIVGTTAVGKNDVDGTYFMDANRGTTVQKIKSSPGIISMAATGASEKSCVMYSPQGYLTYYNLQTGKQIARFNVESALYQPKLFANNNFFVGVKNNVIYIWNAEKGKLVTSIAANSPLLLSSEGEAETGLFFLEQQNKNYALKYIDNEDLRNAYKNHTDVTVKVIGQYTALPKRDVITSGIKLADRIIPVVGVAEGEANPETGKRQQGKIVIGTKSGNIYQASAVANDLQQSFEAMTETTYQKIYDIASYGEDFYFLTKNSIYKSSYNESSTEAVRVGNNSGYTNLIPYGEKLILWSKDSRDTVKLLDLTTGEAKDIIHLKTAIQTLKIFNNTLVYIIGNSSVNTYSLTTNTAKELYTGTALQDAVMMNDNDVYVAKSAASNPASPLIYINAQTGETVSLSVKGTISYSLSYDPESKAAILYGMAIQADTAKGKTRTVVYSYRPTTKTFASLLQFPEEDPEAFTQLSNNYLFTNIGKSQVYSINLESRKSFIYKRSASMPLKVAGNANIVAILNRDGSISWYNPIFSAIKANWYLSTDGYWQEF
ncbi:MAG: hypothetical protein K6F69_07065 [Treponema sp.]|nr:hypothetical protein [Treponema sp.]